MDEVKIVAANPPVFENIVNAFGVLPKGTIYTYGDTIYNPEGLYIRPEIMAHETIHMQQQEQAGGPDLWWGRYLREPEFRIDQEAKAYGMQYRFLCDNDKGMNDRNARYRMLFFLSNILSGPLYGRAISAIDARILITKYSGVDIKCGARPKK
jgi:hypothetical protein